MSKTANQPYGGWMVFSAGGRPGQLPAETEGEFGRGTYVFWSARKGHEARSFMLAASAHIAPRVVWDRALRVAADDAERAQAALCRDGFHGVAADGDRIVVWDRSLLRVDKVHNHAQGVATP